MKIALHQLTSNRSSMEEDLSAFREAGWTSFELDINKVEGYLAGHITDDLADLITGSGLKPIAFSGHVVEAFSSREAIKANEAEFLRKLDFMAAVSCPVIVFGSDEPSEIAAAPDWRESGLAVRDRAYREHLGRFARQVAKLADMAGEKGIGMALEINWCRLCRSASTAAEAIELIDRENVGLIFDPAHFAGTPSRLEDLDLLKGKIIAGHLNDLRNAPLEVININFDRVIPGDGVLPLAQWLAKVEECGYKGWHSVEIFSEELWTKSVHTIAREVMEGCKRIWPDAEF